MPEDILPPSLQESLLALLAFDDKQGSVVAAQIKPEHFGAFHQELAGPILQYWRQYGRAPGHAHIDDIFGNLLFRGDKASRYRKTLAGITDLARGINAEYIAGRTQEHIRWQTIKGAVMRAAELCATKTAEVGQVEQVLYNALKLHTSKLSPGTRLDSGDLSFLDHKPVDFYTNIRELDRLGVGAAMKQMLLYVGPKGTGKTWFCIHMGKQGLLQGAKILHISNEMSELVVTGRYYQSLFAAGTKGDSYLRSSFEYDEFKKLLGWETVKRKPKLHFMQSDIRSVLTSKIQKWGLRLGSIVIKEFPSGTLTLNQYRHYLDYLEAVENFVPTLVIVDYPDLMKQDVDNLRISTGHTFVELRGEASERNHAIIAPTQGGRSTLRAKKVRASNVTEDISKVFTADTSLTYSQTEAEKRSNLARLFVDYARHAQDGAEILISQAYAVGQYALESTFMSSIYWDRMKENGEAEE